MAYLPCLNPNCKSHGTAHPNCKCYDNMSKKETKLFKAENSSLKRRGQEQNQLPGVYRGKKNAMQAKHGLSILGNDYGSGYAEGGEVHFCSTHQKHLPDCEYYAEGGDVEHNKNFHEKPDLALDHAVASHGLLYLLTKTGNSKSEDKFRPIQEFIEHSKKGHAKTEKHVNSMFDKKMEDSIPDTQNIEGLKNHLDYLNQNPEKMFEVGGTLGNHLPDHSGLIAAKAANATQYLNGIKPLGSQISPLDKITPPSKIEMDHYHRQIGIAEQPLSILHKIKNGTVNPKDMQTITALYPHLAKSILDKSFENVAEAKEKGTLIPYKHKMGLSALMGPLDSTQTPENMQAIIKSAAGNTDLSSQQGSKKSGATAQTQKTIDKTNSLYATQTEQLQMNRKD